MSLADLLSSLSLEATLPLFEDEELTLDTLRWMAADEPEDFITSMQELGIKEADAAKLLDACSKCGPETQHANSTPTGTATVPAGMTSPATPSVGTASCLPSFLEALSLQAALPLFEQEELTLEVLRWMATDEPDDFIPSMQELGINAADAKRLWHALSTGGAATSMPALVPATATAPSVAASVPLEGACHGDAPKDLVGKRVLIGGLASRKDLNGKCGTVLFYDDTSGRYTVCTEGTEGVTVALKPANIDAAKAKAVPPPKKAPADSSSGGGRAVRPGVSPLPPLPNEAAKPSFSWQSSTAKAEADASSNVLSEAASAQLEAPERVEAYRKAANWKKEPEPGSIEAFYREKVPPCTACATACATACGMAVASHLWLDGSGHADARACVSRGRTPRDCTRASSSTTATRRVRRTARSARKRTRGWQHGRRPTRHRRRGSRSSSGRRGRRLATPTAEEPWTPPGARVGARVLAAALVAAATRGRRRAAWRPRWQR